MIFSTISKNGVLSLLAASFASGSQIFSNHGLLSGWDTVLEENQGSVQEVTNVVYENSTALKMTQIYDPSYDGRYHSEVHKNDVYKRGDTGFYGFAFRLQENWEFTPDQSYNIGQFIADFSDYGCDDWMPTSMVWIVGNQLWTRVKTGPVCTPTTVPFANLATITAGVWHKIEIQASWKTDGTGFYKLWFDGNKVLEKYDIDTTVTDDRYLGFHVGLYANGWHDDGGMKGNQPTRQVWYDEIAAGTTFADADPDKW